MSERPISEQVGHLLVIYLFLMCVVAGALVMDRIQAGARPGMTYLVQRLERKPPILKFSEDKP